MAFMLIMALAILLLPTLSPTHFNMVQGRQFSKLSNSAMKINEEGLVRMRSVIGSKPPRCDDHQRCKTCGHCEAVQIPIVPSKKLLVERRGFYATPRSIAYSRGEGISNYKPMCWKCKCGDFIFNP